MNGEKQEPHIGQQDPELGEEISFRGGPPGQQRRWIKRMGNHFMDSVIPADDGERDDRECCKQRKETEQPAFDRTFEEEKLIGRGVSSCAPCDGPFFRNKNVIVVGGGDSAMEEAHVLAGYAASVTLVHRKDSFKASEIMVKRVKENPKIKILLNSEIKEIVGEEKVGSVKLFNNKTNETYEMPIDGVFVAIGHIPNSKVFEGVDRDPRGFILVADHYRTNIEGVFVAGDVHDAQYMQAVTAAGFGCAAALETERWLNK